VIAACLSGGLMLTEMALRLQMRNDQSNDGLSAFTIGPLRASIPARLQRWTNYQSFLKSLYCEVAPAGLAHDLAVRILRGEGKKERTKIAVDGLYQLYASYMVSAEVTSKKVKFIVHHNVADMKELISGLFDSYVSPGYGAVEGLSIISGMDGSGQVSRLTALVNHLHQRSDLELACFGMANHAGRVVNMLTGRPVSIIDAEQMCCKGAVCLSKARGTRAFNIPRPSEPHCWPSKANFVGPLFSQLADIVDNMVGSYESLCAQQLWPEIPRVFLLPGEQHPTYAPTVSSEV
jgi:hypothetical protein